MRGTASGLPTFHIAAIGEDPLSKPLRLLCSFAGSRSPKLRDEASIEQVYGYIECLWLVVILGFPNSIRLSIWPRYGDETTS